MYPGSIRALQTGALFMPALQPGDQLSVIMCTCKIYPDRRQPHNRTCSRHGH